MHASVVRDKRLDIINVEVHHKVSSIVKKANKDRDIMTAHKGAKHFGTRQPEIPLVTPEISVEF